MSLNWTMYVTIWLATRGKILKCLKVTTYTKIIWFIELNARRAKTIKV
jgi:hypothetical protein